MNRIKQNYGVSIRIPTEQENSGEIRIEGSPDGVAQAKSELSEMAQRMVNASDFGPFILSKCNIDDEKLLQRRVSAKKLVLICLKRN